MQYISYVNYASINHWDTLLRMFLFKLKSHFKQFFIRNFWYQLKVCMNIRNHFSCIIRLCMILRFWNSTRSWFFWWMRINSNPLRCTLKLTRCSSFYSLFRIIWISLLWYELKCCGIILRVLTLLSVAAVDSCEKILVSISEPFVWSVWLNLVLRN